MAKNKKNTQALCKQTAFNKEENSIKQASNIYKSIKIG